MRHGDRFVVGQHVSIERIDHRIVDVRLQYTFAQIVQDQDAWRAAESAECGLMHLGPEACAGSEDDQPDTLAAVAERQHKQACAAIAA